MRFVNLKEKKFFLQNLLPGWVRFKKKIHPASGLETRYFSRRPYGDNLKGGN